MNYYKLVLDNTIIGAITSDNFVRYSPVTKRFVRADEETGEYIDYMSKVYRSSWLRPIKQPIDFISILAIKITEEEYNIYAQAIEKKEIIYNDTPQEEDTTPSYTDPIEVASIDFIKAAKLSEMSYTCRKTIENGFDLEIQGEIHHFSMDTQDQLNLISLSMMTATQELIPYHADGEECKFFTAAEMNSIVAAATAHKVYHTTYYNALKQYINSLETIEAINAITYGAKIPEEYQTDVLKELLK